VASLATDHLFPTIRTELSFLHAAMEPVLPWEGTKGSNTSFLVCGMAAQGSPVVYVSRGLQSLFGFAKSECEGRPADSVLRALPVAAQDKQLAVVAQTLGLTPDDVDKKLHFLACYASLEHQDVVQAGLSEKIGVALRISRNYNGDLFTCEVTTLTLKSPTAGVCSASVQRDVTDQVPVDTLLRAAGSGEYFRLMQGRRRSARDPESLAHIRARVVPALRARLERAPRATAQQEPTSLEELPEFLPDGGRATEGWAPTDSYLRRMAPNKSCCMA